MTQRTRVTGAGPARPAGRRRQAPDPTGGAARSPDPTGDLAGSPAATGAAARPADLTGAVGRPAGSPAGLVLAVLSVGPALLTAGWLVVAFPLAAAGWLRPYPTLALALPAAAGALLLGAGAWPGGGRRWRRPVAVIDAPWWTVAACVAVAAGFAWFTAATHSEQVVLRRDPGAYAHIGYWLSQHGRLTAAVPAAAFGPSPGALTFASPGFYEQGGSIVPQFMTGWPTLLAAAGWLGGWRAMLVLPALVGAGMVLSVAGVAARLVGARWAPLAALLTALAWPVLRVAQTTYSEPLAFVMLAGGVCLLVDVVLLTARPGPDAAPPDASPPGAAPAGAGATRATTRVGGRAFAAGLVLAGGELVRLDFGVDFALAVPVVAALWLARRPGPGPFLAGAGLGGGLAVIDAALVTRPYVVSNWSSVRLMIALVTASAAGSLAVAAVLRRARRPLRQLAWWPAVAPLACAGVLVAGGALAARPYLGTDHSTSDPGVMEVTTLLQRRLGLPVDPSRGYVEQSLHWVSWYLGWPLLVAALAAAAVLAWRVARGRERGWLVALPVYGGGAALTLAHPGITPDHPWADRRLVVEVIPAAVLLATWAVAAACRWLGGRLPGPAGRAVPAVVAVAALAAYLVPTLGATAPVAARRTELGQLAAARRVCAALGPDDSVVLLDGVWAPTIRNQCRLPAAQLTEPSPQAVQRVVASIRAAGRRPVIAGAYADELAAQGLSPTRVVGLRTEQDDQQLVRRPTTTQPLDVEFWLVRP